MKIKVTSKKKRIQIIKIFLITWVCFEMRSNLFLYLMMKNI